jgi:hypothetical protein
MLTSRALSKRAGRKRTSLRNSQDMLSLIADKERKADITDAQAETLRKYLMSIYLSENLQIVFEPFVGETQQRLEDKFDNLLEYISHLEWR